MVSYRYLGSALTNANGVATFDYQGTGAGEIDVIASLDKPITDGSIVSETLSVLDTLLYDTGTDATHNIWTGDTSNLTRGSEYSRLEESTIGSMVQLNATMPTGLWVLTMTVKKDGNNGDWNINILNNNVSVFGCGTPANDVWTDITLVYDGSFISYFVNGSTTPSKKTSVMLDESKTTVLRLQTPQNITYIDFKDLIVLREGKSAISIGSSNPIIQSGDTATIKGSLYESGLIVKNATLDVYKNGTKVGTASTGDSGVASYTYTGVADGEVEFQFKYGSIVSEIYEVLDGTFLDRGTSTDHNNNWEYIANKVSRSYTSDGTATVLTMGTGQTWGYVYVNNQNYKFDLPLCMEFDLVEIIDSPRIRFKGDTSSFAYILSNYGTGHYKWIISKTDISLTVDGVSKSVALSMDRENGLCIYWEFDSDTDGLTYKNFVIYPI